MAIVIETLSKDGKVLKQYSIDKPQVSIGRAYDNDICIDDPYVSPHHLVFALGENQKSLRIIDLGSLNGVKVNGSRQHGSDVSYKDTITLGRTRIRVFTPNQQVEPTIILSELEENMAWLGMKRVCFMLLSLIFGLITLKYINNNPAQFEASLLVEAFIKYVMVVSIWPLAFVLLSKLAKKDPHTISQFSLLWLFLIALEILNYCQLFLQFNVASVTSISWLGLITKGVLFFILFWFSSFLAFHQSKRARNLIVSTGTALVSLYVVFPLVFNANDFNPNPSYKTVLMAPVFRVATTTNTLEYVQRSEKLIDKLQPQRTSTRD
jgi:hypothetical protein